MRTRAAVRRIRADPTGDRVVGVHTGGRGHCRRPRPRRRWPDPERGARGALRSRRPTMASSSMKSIRRAPSPGIFAIGDCSSHPSALYLRAGCGSSQCRMHWARHVPPPPRSAAPRAPMSPCPGAGPINTTSSCRCWELSHGRDQVIRRGRAEAMVASSRSISRPGRIIAADAVNRPKDFLAAKRLVGELARISPREVGRAEPAASIPPLAQSIEFLPGIPAPLPDNRFSSRHNGEERREVHEPRGGPLSHAGRRRETPCRGSWPTAAAAAAAGPVTDSSTPPGSRRFPRPARRRAHCSKACSNLSPIAASRARSRSRPISMG